MHLKDLKSQINSSIKKISAEIHKDKKKKLVKLFFITFLIFFFILIFSIFYNSDIPTFLIKLNHKKDKNIKNPILKSAEEAYENGFLENSAIYYKTYLNKNIKNVEKVIAYKRLFEISVLKNNFNEALSYLDKIEEIDKKSSEVHLNKIKIYLRLNQFPKALKEIISNQQKLKRSIEFREVSAIYYMKTGDFKKALNILEKISYNKREFFIHKKIILCYLKLNQFKNSITYISKIENKIKSLDEKKNLAEFYLLKAISKIFLDDNNDAIGDLKKVNSLATDYKENASKLMLYSNIVLDNPDDIFNTIENLSGETVANDISLFKNIGDYFIYKNDFKKALFIYSQIEKKKELNKGELMVLADLYYHTKDYIKSINTINNLFETYNYRGPELYKNLSLLYSKLNDQNNEIFFLREGINYYRDDLDFYVRFSKFYIDNNEPYMALQYIKEAKDISDNNKNIIYDKRLDILYILALQQTSKNLTERELLNLREKESDNVEYYFQIIKYYIDSYKFSEAKRELETAFKLQLSNEQIKTLNTYKIILALFTNNNDEYQKAKEELFGYQNKSYSDKINIALINLYEDDYDQSLDMLNLINIYNLPDKVQNKVLYFKALCYFYKSEYPLSLELINKILDKEPANMKASYLKDLINKKYGVIK